MRLFIPVTFVVVSILSGGLTAARAQSLADLARKEEQRKKTVKDPGKVYTNKDLGSVPPAPAPVPPPAETAKPAGEADASKGAPAGAATEEAKEPVKDQAYWSGRMMALRGQLARDQIYADALQTRVNSLTADFTARDDPAQRAVIAADKQKALDELNRLKLSIEEGKKAVADLEEEARRAGAPPGWLR